MNGPAYRTEGARTDDLDVGRLARCYGHELYRRALRILRESDDAWDLVQDTYARALECGPGDLSDPRALAWLSLVMRNLGFDRLRAQRRRPQADLSELPELEARLAALGRDQ